MRAVLLLCTGCNVIFGFDSITPLPDATMPDSAPAVLPIAATSPGPQPIAGGYAYAATIKVTIAADDPSAMIFYTTDGSLPSTTSMHAPTPVTGVTVSANTVISYYALTAAGQSPSAQDHFFIDTSTTNRNLTGYIVDQVVLDGTSPVVDVTPGQKLTMASAHVQAWVQSVVPGAAMQVVYGVDTSDQGCLYDGSPGVYPGVTRTPTFTVTAPMTPGPHEVRIANSEQTSCAQAMGMQTLKTRPDVTRIGVLVVH